MIGRKRIAPFVLALVVALVSAACVESGEDTTTTTAAAVTTTTAATEETPTTEALPEAPEKILIGNPIALSGPNAGPAETTQISSYDTWAADVNAAGGIYVEEYDQQIPVEFVRVDDTSDVPTAVSLTQQMLEEGEVHFIFPPWGTAFNFAIAPIISEAETPVMGCTVSSKDLKTQAHNFPYFYTMLNQGDTQGAALVELIQELGIQRVAVIHHTDLHGIEFAGDVVPQLTAAGVEIPVYKAFPLFTEDMSQLLREVQDADVEALIAFSYPPETFLMTGQMIEIGLSPDLFYATVGIAFPAYREAFGPAAEGVMGSGVWNPDVPTEDAQGFYDRHVALHGAEPDRWASAACYATGQVLHQAIEAAGTLDPKAVKAVMDTTEFNTILGTFMFDNRFLPIYPGEVGQWQDGEFQVVSFTEDRTAEPVYPKPSWS